jgi:hypothetical protein
VYLKRWIFFILLCCVLLGAADISYAAGMLMRVQQMKQQREHPGQMTPEQYQQYQEYQEQQRGDQSQSQQPPAQPTYQQTVDQRNQAIAQAILNAHNQAVNSADQATGNTNNGVVNQPSVAIPTGSNAQDVVDLSEVWKKLDKKSTVWPLLMDDQAKLLTVSEYLDRFHKQGVKINAPPTHYVQMIDQITQGNPQMLQRPFGELLQILAIIDYDFDNGMDKDALARAVLGEAGYETNKRRFTQASQQQQQR